MGRGTVRSLVQDVDLPVAHVRKIVSKEVRINVKMRCCCIHVEIPKIVLFLERQGLSMISIVCTPPGNAGAVGRRSLSFYINFPIAT